MVRYFYAVNTISTKYSSYISGKKPYIQDDFVSKLTDIKDSIIKFLSALMMDFLVSNEENSNIDKVMNLILIEYKLN